MGFIFSTGRTEKCVNQDNDLISRVSGLQRKLNAESGEISYVKVKRYLGKDETLTLGWG